MKKAILFVILRSEVTKNLRLFILVLLGAFVLPGFWSENMAAAFAQAAVPIQNGDFEGPARQTFREGTSISSWLAVDWVPWSVLGDSTHNREVEYKLITLETGRNADLRSHVHNGNHAQQFFTNGGTHTAGFYQKVRVPANSQVTFTIWAQMQTGNNLLFVEGRYVSDLKGGGGNYYVQVGIDPSGATPGGFGAPLPASIQWSDPLWDITAHGQDEKGNPADLWVPLTLSARAQGEWVTLYTRGQCKYPTKYNSSFWDDASLTAAQPPTPTRPPPTATPTTNLRPTEPPTVTPTATLSPTPEPTATSLATATVEPTYTATATPTPTQTATPSPTTTSTATPSWTATPTQIAQLARPSPTPTLVVYATPAETPAAKMLVMPQWIGLLGVAVAIILAMVVGLLMGHWLARGRK